MVSKFYQRINGKIQEIEVEGLTKEAQSHFVHQDTLEKPLRHPVTGRIHDSKSGYMRDCEATNTRVVGNDWVGTTPEGPKDLIDDALIMDRMRKAEAILRDPAKRRERQQLNYRMAEHNDRFMKNGKI